MSVYSAELYQTIAEYGVARGAAVLDVRCGNGDAGEPFAANGFPVTSATLTPGTPHQLPFPDERFNVAISAQCFGFFDRAAALAEIFRVLRSRGIVAVWWKKLIDDPQTPPGGLTGGFREFYAAPFVDQTLRVLPWRTADGGYVQYLYLGRKR